MGLKCSKLEDVIQERKSILIEQKKEEPIPQQIHVKTEPVDESDSKSLSQETFLTKSDLNGSREISCYEIEYESNELSEDNLKLYSFKCFLNQDIVEIRRKYHTFTDPYFKPLFENITKLKNPANDFIKGLIDKFNINPIGINVFVELGEKIKWERCPVIAYNNVSNFGRRNEFVLNEYGKPLTRKFQICEYLKLFTMHDIFQGALGDCMLIATIMGITRNKALLSFLIPVDNLVNYSIGAYHFRLWKLGEFYDVVIDDYLPVDAKFNLIFARNVTYVNEYWIALFEKAVSK